MKLRSVAVVSSAPLADGFHSLSIENDFPEKPVPGQFLHVDAGPGTFLRRPFSIAWADSRHIRLLYRVRGKGTDYLSRRKPGDYLNALGPLGNGFPTEPVYSRCWLVAGGSGIAPLAFLLSELLKRSCRPSLLYGAKTESEILETVLPKGSYERAYSTDDGSRGFPGTVTAMLRDKFRKDTPEIIFAAGPIPALKETVHLAGKKNVPSYVTLESRMACGMGICYGCVIPVKTRTGWEYRRVCSDGPVFRGEDIAWDRDMGL